MPPGRRPADATPPRLARLPTWLLTRTSAVAHGLLGASFAAAGARGHEYRLLAALGDLGPASQAALGRRTGVDRSDVVAAIDALAARGLVGRAPDPDDRRRNIITISDEGTVELRALDAVVSDAQDRLLAPLSSAERRELTQLLVRVLEHHEGQEDGRG